MQLEPVNHLLFKFFIFECERLTRRSQQMCSDEICEKNDENPWNWNKQMTCEWDFEACSAHCALASHFFVFIFISPLYWALRCAFSLLMTINKRNIWGSHRARIREAKKNMFFVISNWRKVYFFEQMQLYAYDIHFSFDFCYQNKKSFLTFARVRMANTKIPI